MGWTLCTDRAEGHVGWQPGFCGAIMLQHTDNRVVGFVMMANSNGTYSDTEARTEWFDRAYAPMEQLLFETAPEMAPK